MPKLEDSIILLRPNLWAGDYGTIVKVIQEKAKTIYLVKVDRGFHAHATAEEMEVI